MENQVNNELSEINLAVAFLRSYTFVSKFCEKLSYEKLRSLLIISTHILASDNCKNDQFTKISNENAMKQYTEKVMNFFSFSKIFILNEQKIALLKVQSLTFKIWGSRLVKLDFIHQNLLISSKSPKKKDKIIDLRKYKLENIKEKKKNNKIFYFSLISVDYENKC